MGENGVLENVKKALVDILDEDAIIDVRQKNHDRGLEIEVDDNRLLELFPGNIGIANYREFHSELITTMNGNSDTSSIQIRSSYTVVKNNGRTYRFVLVHKDQP